MLRTDFVCSTFLTLSPKLHNSGGDRGFCSSPVFSPCSLKLAYLSMARDGNESDRNNVIIYDFEKKTSMDYRSEASISALSFDSITWGNPDTSKASCLYMVAQFRGANRIFEWRLDPSLSLIECLVMNGDASRTTVVPVGQGNPNPLVSIRRRICTNQSHVLRQTLFY